MIFRRALVVVEAGADPGEARAALHRVAPAGVETRVAPAGTIADAAAAFGPDVIVVGARGRAVRREVAEARQWLSVAVLWADGPVPAPAGAGTHVLCVALGARGLAAIGVFLRDHAAPEDRVSLITVGAPAPIEDLPALMALAGVRATVTLRPPTVSWLVDPAPDVDLLVTTRAPPGLFVERLRRRGLLTLVLPPLPPPATSGPSLHVADIVDVGGPLRVRVEQAGALGRAAPLHEQEVGFVARGRLLGTAFAVDGQAELPVAIEAPAVGVYRTALAPADDPLAAVERAVAIVRPGDPPPRLFDANLDDTQLAEIARSGDALAVRLRPERRLDALRDRLRAAGVSPARVVDAATILDEGEPLDVPEEADPVRLDRIAARLRAGRSLAERLDATTRALASDGNRVEIELDNREARRRLLDAVAGSAERVHLQTYMLADDPVAREVEDALIAAAARGVTVRVLVDSLHALHGSLGVENPVLVRLAAHASVEVRAARPVVGVPSIDDLKRRDHRKLVVVDGAVGLAGGRNIAHEYYAGFDEVAVTPFTPWRQVPWLDAGARVRGPAVAALDGAFRDAWVAAGGAPFAVHEPAVAGTTRARIVVHEGLRDANTLEAYLALIDTARRTLHVVNSFPLQLELQRALLRAVARGVRVRLLFGNVVPTHGEVAFSGPLVTARALATQLVHSRLDPLIAAGAEGYELVIAGEPGWDASLGPVRPHVHAKLVCADGRAAAVGSANLDITAAYWESELLVVVEDEAVVAGVEEEVGRRMAGSRRIDPEDPAWQALAARRAWMRHWPGMIG